ncbi:MAG: CotH kinase family protein [Planctomycetota bacterium]
MQRFGLLLAAAVAASPAPARAAARVVVSEVGQRAPEFLELHNPGAAEADLTGWTLTGDVQLVLGKDARIPAGGRLLLVQSRRDFAEVYGEALAAAAIEFAGRIRDEGSLLTLSDASGAQVDAVRYGAAPAVGSLQRLDATTPYRGPLNWEPAEPTPGAAYPGARPLPPLALDGPAEPSAARPGAPLAVSARLHGAPPARATLRWLTRSGGPGQAPLTWDPPAAGRPLTLRGALPALPPLTAVDYWFEVEGAGVRRELRADPLSGRRLRLVAAGPVEGAPAPDLPVLALEVSPEALRRIEGGGATEEDPLVGAPLAATLCAADPGAAPLAFDVELEARGGGERPRRWAKRAWVVTLAGEQRWRGMRRVLLGSSWRDPVGLRPVLGFDLYRRAGVPAPRARLVQVLLNGRFFGAYTEVEAVDAAFLVRHGLLDAALFDPRPTPRAPGDRDREQVCDGRALPTLGAYEAHWGQTAGPPSYEALRDFVASYQQGSPAERGAALARSLDRERYVAYLAVTALIHHWDSVDRNFYWCLDRATGRWFVIPWDLDRSWGDHFRGRWRYARAPLDLGTSARPIRPRGREAWSRLRDAALAQEELRAALEAKVAALLATELAPAGVAARAERLLAPARPALLADRARWPELRSKHTGGRPVARGGAEQLERELAGLRAYAAERARYLAQARLPRERRPDEAPVVLMFAAGLALYARWARPWSQP